MGPVKLLENPAKWITRTLPGCRFDDVSPPGGLQVSIFFRSIAVLCRADQGRVHQLLHRRGEAQLEQGKWDFNYRKPEI